jgi:threonine-phosphate decarboxylase
MMHGGDIYSHKENMLDFSANITPLGASETLKRAIRESAEFAEFYPDVKCRKLTEKIAQYEKISKDFIICSNGAGEMIYSIVLALKPKKALLICPSFSEYELALNTVGADIKYYNCDENFEVGEDYIDFIDDADMIFICNPNNPTGKTVDMKIIERAVEICRKKGIYAVIDECFANFTDNPQKNSIKHLVCENKSIIILKAFTKMYAMAGIRLGYAITSNNDVSEKIKASRQPWSVSVTAQMAGVAVLEEKFLEEKTREYVKKERKYITENFDRLQIEYIKPEANYVFFKERKDLYKLLLEYDIIIRDCENYRGLEKGFFRVAVKKHSENERLINALERIKQNG